MSENINEDVKGKILLLAEYESISMSDERRLCEFGEKCYSLSTQRIKELEDTEADLRHDVKLFIKRDVELMKQIMAANETIATQSATIQHQKFLIEKLQKEVKLNEHTQPDQ